MVIPFSFLNSSWSSHGKYTGVVCRSLLQWLTFCQNSPLWPIHLGWPCMAWLIASLSYASPFATTRHWSMKGIHESPLNSKEIKTVNPRGNLPWIFIGRTDAEAEAPVLWPPDTKSWLTGKDSDAGEDWGQEKGMTEDKMVGWHHWLNGHEFEQTLGDGEGQGSLACCSPWCLKELDLT